MVIYWNMLESPSYRMSCVMFGWFFFFVWSFTPHSRSDFHSYGDHNVPDPVWHITSPRIYMTLTFGSGTVYSCFYNFSRSVATRDQTLISGMRGKPALPTELMQWLVLEKNYHLNGSIVLSLFWWYLHLEKCVWHPSFQQIEVPFTPRIYI